MDIEDSDSLETIFDDYEDPNDIDDIDNIDDIDSKDEILLENISENEYKSSLISIEEFNTFYKEYKKEIKTSKILNKYEKTKILSERAEQLSEGAIPLIPNADKYNNVLEIAEEELKEKKIPFIIKRMVNNKFEYIKIEDLVIL
tara:strand:+ start:2022 stop:2453 length:432 start_codon:yes stop_codon:yes gene_type:complete